MFVDPSKIKKPTNKEDEFDIMIPDEPLNREASIKRKEIFDYYSITRKELKLIGLDEFINKKLLINLPGEHQQI